MMKKRFGLTLVAALLIAISAVFLLGACTNLKNYEPKETNLAEGASYLYDNGKTKNSMSLSASGESSVKVRFPKETTFNTVMLKATNDNVDAFEIEIGGEVVYKQDEIGDVRTCWLGERTASEIIIRVTASDGKYKINWLGVYNMERGNKSFRRTTYLETGDNGESLDTLETEGLKHLDQVILFSAVNFCLTKDSTLRINLPVLEKAIAVLRSANPELEIIVNLLPKIENDLEWPDSVAKTHTDAFTNNPKQLVAQINELLTKYDLHGIGFDYEYPQTKKDWRAYSDFLVLLNEGIGTKLISTAIQYGGADFTKEARNAVDQYEVMCYDFIGKNNSHSTFHDAISMTLAILEKEHYDMSKVNLGLPFYSRPQEKAGKWELIRYWGAYEDYYTSLGKYSNTAAVNKTIDNLYIGTLYFNSYQMIADKTAFLYDYGVGGIMIWQYTYDVAYENELSLLRAINDALGIV